ncbi:hypothetical protein KUCAC02_036433 [Chaenocephalus aceratus]|nr:hypothetical protein KUCAC02_036433 [Chaenocephalus aceratus]
MILWTVDLGIPNAEPTTESDSPWAKLVEENKHLDVLVPIRGPLGKESICTKYTTLDRLTLKSFFRQASGLAYTVRIGAVEMYLHDFSPTALCSLSSCVLQPEFVLFKEKKTWREAQSFCREDCLDLATIEDLGDIENSAEIC